MILQALTQYYEDLLAHGKIDRPGWAVAKVSWALELREDGSLFGPVSYTHLDVYKRQP